MTISFTKMHGLGNDFVVIDATEKKQALSSSQIKIICDRHFGVGCDQLLLIEQCDTADFFCRIYNPDASEAEQCGNGLRAVARYLNEQQRVNKHFSLATKAGRFPIKIKDYDHITIALPIADNRIEKVTINDHELITVSMGNPHALIRVNKLNDINIREIGQFLSSHSTFKEGANIGFFEVHDKDHLSLRTFERGAGLTHACGSNACATFIAAIENNWLNHKANIAFEFGELAMEWLAEQKTILMTGPASKVFDGVISQ